MLGANFFVKAAAFQIMGQFLLLALPELTFALKMRVSVCVLQQLVAGHKSISMQASVQFTPVGTPGEEHAWRGHEHLSLQEDGECQWPQ